MNSDKTRNCSSKVARRGWDIYRATDPPPTIDELNDALAAIGYEEVAPRTYDHYGRLRRHGFVDYVSINEHDVIVKLRRKAAEN